MNIVNNIYESGKVLRYHANPVMNVFTQTDADHAWGCVALVLHLHPNPSVALLGRTVFHDAGERWAGDVPYPFKMAEPAAAALHAKVEYALAKKHGIPQYELTEEEELWVSLVDRLEAYLYCRLRRPDIAKGPDWVRQNDSCLKTAKQLGVYDKVKEIFNE